MKIRVIGLRFPLQYCVAERKVQQSAVIWKDHVFEDLQKKLNDMSDI